MNAISVSPSPDQRWLIIAPHPDDEVLSSAITIQRVLGAGAALRVLLVTDGDNNPWPQRVLERRWRIDAAARRRWAQRRRAEVRAALTVLGADPDQVLTTLSWPDGGVEGYALAQPAACLGALSQVIASVAPTHLVVPSAADRHPDHNTLALLVAMLLPGLAPDVVCSAYRVHADAAAAGGSVLVPSREELDCRSRALACHRSQMLLSGRRMRRLAAGSDRHLDFQAEFQGDAGASPDFASGTASPRAGEDLLVATLGAEGPTLRRWTAAEVLQNRHLGGVDPSPAARIAGGAHRCWVKPVPVRRGLWIYDRMGWRVVGR